MQIWDLVVLFFSLCFFHLSERRGGEGMGDKWGKRCLVVLAGHAPNSNFFFPRCNNSTYGPQNPYDTLTKCHRDAMFLLNRYKNRCAALNLAALQPSNQADYSFN